jgi:phosphate:Na+ symporter
MLRKLLLPTTLALLSFGFWKSPDFKEIAAGVAIFLFGMLSLEEGFKAFTGGVLENLLKRTTASLWKSLGFGIVTTTVMQSSSLVSVITISFLSAGLIDLAAGIGIVFGANLGTTTGAWLIAGFGLKVKISAYAMPMLVFGVLLIFQKTRHLKGLGSVLAGLGFLFLGIHHMKAGFEAFRHTLDLTTFAVVGYPGVFLFTLLGVIATVIMQSSHATLVLIITALSAGQITYENALALAIGANVGTTITAILGSMSANVQGKRLAAAHLIFNLTTALIAISFIYQLKDLVAWMSGNLGIAATDFSLQLAVFHTVFNLIGVVVMLPFVSRLVNFLTHFMPERQVSIAYPRYLHPSAMALPAAALGAVRQETLHLYENAFRILVHGLNLHRHAILSDRPLEEIVQDTEEHLEIDIDGEYERTVKSLYGQIVAFISRASTTMTPEEANELFALRAAGRDMVEAIKDTKHLRKNLTQYIVSPNPCIRAEYNKIRVQVGGVLRQLEQAQSCDYLFSVQDLETLRVEMEENDSTANGTLEHLIREEKITPEMATSLMNDATYAYDVTKNLVQIGGLLFGQEALLDTTRNPPALNQEEIDALVHSGESPTQGLPLGGQINRPIVNPNQTKTSE